MSWMRGLDLRSQRRRTHCGDGMRRKELRSRAFHRRDLEDRTSSGNMHPIVFVDVSIDMG